MRFRVGDTALYQHRDPCVVLKDDHSNIPYFVQFLSDLHPDVAVHDCEQEAWIAWCFESELSPFEVGESTVQAVDLSEVL